MEELDTQTEHRSTPFGAIVRVHLPKLFDIYLEGRFPFDPPRICCESVEEFPSIADGRDLVFEVIQRNWVPSISAAEIVGLLPDPISLPRNVTR